MPRINKESIERMHREAFVFQEDGAPYLGEDGQPNTAFVIMHPFLTYAIGPSGQSLPEFDQAVISKIGQEQFFDIIVQAKLLESRLLPNDPEFPPERQDAISKFSDLYRLLSSQTEEGKKIRRAIEAIFAALKLGPIPPMQFAEKMETPNKGGGRNA